MIAKLSEQQKNQIINKVLEVMRLGYGKVEIVIHQHKITEINKQEKERMTKGGE